MQPPKSSIPNIFIATPLNLHNQWYKYGSAGRDIRDPGPEPNRSESAQTMA